MNSNSILQVKTDIGLLRKKNEDSAIAITHPHDFSIKLLAVADGMGGRSYGEVASSLVTLELENWFFSKSCEELNDTHYIISDMEKFVQVKNRELVQKYGSNCLGTTLTVALINNYQTVILNVGDSRCYSYVNNCLIQITEDDSDVWSYYKSGRVGKEDLRYFSTSNLITTCVGLDNYFCHCKFKVLDNKSYSLLLLLTDGVTDLLTDYKIQFIIEDAPKEKILEQLIYEAVYVDQKLSVPNRLVQNFLEPFIIPRKGKDNATGAIFISKYFDN